MVLPTGTGKSLVLAQIAKDAVEKWNGRVLILAHVKELLEQNADKIRKLCPELKIVDHFFIFQKNSLHLKMANFSSLKRRSIFTSRKILREKLELHSASKKSLNIAKMVEKRFELPTSTHDLSYEKIRLADCHPPYFFLTRAKILTRA